MNTVLFPNLCLPVILYRFPGKQLLEPFGNFYFTIIPTIMYLLVYPALTTPPRAKSVPQLSRPATVGIDFVTPDGIIVPRAAGEAALLGHTAVLIGGLLVGFWS